MEEAVLLGQTENERKDFYKNNRIVANQDVLEMFFVIDKHLSYRETYKSERMISAEEGLRLSKRKSEDLIRSSGQHKPLIRVTTRD